MPTPNEDPVLEDIDGDGATAAEDCDDTNPAAAPGLAETCDGIDNDCDGEIDEDDAIGVRRWFVDQDRDGWGRDSTEYAVACAPPTDHSYAERHGDCDDLDASANNGALERCDDGIDNDCDGVINEADDNTDPDTIGTWYVDGDGDGFGDPLRAVEGCARPDDGEVWVTNPSDCDDGDALTHPGAAASDGADLCTRDRDGDGYGDSATGRAFSAGTDCDDAHATVNPGAAEACDGVDTDCAGGLGPTEDDSDSDRWVSCTITASGWLGDPAVRGGDDCAPADGSRHPGADERCNGADDDCDGITDEADAVDAGTYQPDADGDGYGAGAGGVVACTAPADHVLAVAGPGVDCDDGDPAVFPGATELCNGTDDDCDGTTDESDAADAVTWYVDGDADGYGGLAVAGVACTPITGASQTNTDCDDTDGDANPGATEVCSGVDDDCDGLIDDNDPSVNILDPWYLDGDGDGYGDLASPLAVCAGPTGFVDDASDCDDGDAAVSPSATEVCRNGVDDDCDGTATGCEAVGTLSLPSADAWFEGDVGAVAAGSAGLFVDLDGDGLDDVVVGAPGARSGGAVGGAYIFHGTATGGLDVSAADVSLFGDVVGEQAGATLAAGDVNDDGVPDLVVGSCPPPTAVTSVGRAFVFLGPVTSSGNLEDGALTLEGVDEDDALGCSLSASGDITGDSIVDLLVGVPGEDSGGRDAGGVWLYTGPLSAGAFAGELWLEGVSTGDGAGGAVASGLDLDGDAVEDMVVGAPGASASGGAAYVALGPVTVGSDLSVADARLAGQVAGDLAGTAVASAGDLNDDGYTDLLIGAPGHDVGATDGGAVYVVLGRSGAWVDRSLSFASGRVTGSSARGGLGSSVSAAGDTDADGILEFVAGAPDATVGTVTSGGVWRFVGPVTGTATDAMAAAIWVGKASGDGAGAAVQGGGNVDGDDFSDLLMGAPGLDQYSFGLSAVGGLYLVRGTGL